MERGVVTLAVDELYKKVPESIRLHCLPECILSEGRYAREGSEDANPLSEFVVLSIVDKLAKSKDSEEIVKGFEQGLRDTVKSGPCGLYMVANYCVEYRIQRKKRKITFNMDVNALVDCVRDELLRNYAALSEVYKLGRSEFKYGLSRSIERLIKVADGEVA